MKTTYRLKCRLGARFYVTRREERKKNSKKELTK